MSNPSPTQFTGKQIQQLCDALLDAFPTRDDLRMVVRIELDTNLDAVAGGENLRVVVFNLVSWAEQTGHLHALVAGACAQNPDNPRLQELQASAQSWWAAAMPTAATDERSPQVQTHRVSGPTAIDLFLTYSREDAASMRTVQETLHGAGLTVWTDEGLAPGTPNWEDAIAEAIHQAQGMVVLLSPHARMSEWVKRELAYARTHGKQIFPLLLEGDERTAVPFGLIGTQWVDGRGRVSEAARELLPALLRHLGRAAARVTFDWLTIPAGAFLMGSDKLQDQDAYDEELPQHTVHLPAYRIARVPVTVAQFAAYVEATGYRTEAERRGSAFVWTGTDYKDVKGANWQHPRGPESDVRQKQDHPVTCVSWQDAAAFCQWTSQATGNATRLPTEAEWEKAARGTDGRFCPWGNQAADAKRCNFNMNVGDTTPVGSYPSGASPYGVLDMAGNVWEWTNSIFHSYPYRSDDGREAPGASGQRTLRGGSFYYGVRDVRCACRYNDIFRVSVAGFRVMSPDC